MYCQFCGKCDETVFETIDPYAADVDNEEIDVIICQKCYAERVDDI